MDEDFVMDDQQKIQGEQATDDTGVEEMTCGSADTRHKDTTLTSLVPPSATHFTPGSDVYIPQANSSRVLSPTTTSNQSSMARPLGRTRTLGQVGRTESFNDVFSAPVSASNAPLSLLQHRESSAALDNDDDDDEDRQRKPSGIRIDIDGDDECENGSQIIGSQDVPMNEPQAAPNPTVNFVGPTSPPRGNLVVNTTDTADPRRFPSPIPTEPEDPDPEFISNQLANQKIKVRDFAMYPPYTTSVPTPSTPSAVTIDATSPPTGCDADNSSHILSVPLTPETFNPREAISQFEFRLRQSPRALPIPGKTIRRLIEIGWVSENEVESRCSQEDLKCLDEFDSRNRARLLRLTALREQRVKDLGISSESASGPEEIWGFTPTGAYPYLTLKFDSIPSLAGREEIVKVSRKFLSDNDRFIRMFMATEKARERDRIEAEEVLMKRKREEEEKEKERLEREWQAIEALQSLKNEQDEVMQDASFSRAKPQATAALQPPAEISTAPINSRKRSPHQAWADDEDYIADNDIDDLDAKRVRLARSQSETWYEQERRLQQGSQSPGSQTPVPQSIISQSQHHTSPSSRVHSRPQSQTPRKAAINSQSQHTHARSDSQSKHTHSRSQSQPTNFVPPGIQYPAPLSTYDPELYPDAASAIESQSQSQGRNAYRGVTPPASPPSGDELGGEGKGGGGGGGRGSSMVGRGIGLGEDGEEDNRPNALKRSPKKGLKRTLTRGRTLVEIC